MKIKRSVLDFWNAHSTTILLVVLLLVFVGSSVFFALKLERAIIPDEPAHFIISKQFSTTWGIPPIVPGHIYLGYINHKPFLYYWINGRILDVLGGVFPGISDWQKLVSLRLTSVFYSLISLIFCYLLAKEIIKNRWWQLLAPFLLANTLMFVFLSGGVNYDNLTTLFAFAGIYFLVRVFNNRPFYKNSLGWLIFISAGTITEKKALPLALIMGVLWLIYIVKNRSHINFPPKWDWSLITMATLFFVLLLLNLSIWGVNLVKYHALKPPCNQILTVDQCNRSPFVARAEQLNLPEKLTWKDIIKGGYPDPLEYLGDYWIPSMLKRIYGIMGHKSYFPDLIITFYRLLIIWVMAVAIRHWKKPSYTIGSLIAIFSFYFVSLLWINYNNELVTGFKHVAVQGRYIFPVIGIAYILAVHYISQIHNTTVRRVTVLYTLLLFLWGSPLLLFVHFPSTFTSWFH